MGVLTIKLRRGTSNRWTTLNPVLSAGEPGYEKDTGKLKIGDGQTAWNDLDYLVGDVGDLDESDLLLHIDDELPHPNYDDGTSFFLLYENAKV